MFEIFKHLQILKSESEDNTTIKSPAHKSNWIWQLQILQLAPTPALLILCYLPPLAIKYAIWVLV